MASVTLQPFDARTARNRAIAPSPTPEVAPTSFWQGLVSRYWAGWEHYARAYSAELDQRPALTPSVPPIEERRAETARRLPRIVSIR